MDGALHDRHEVVPHRPPVVARAAALAALGGSVLMLAAVLLDGPQRAPASSSLTPQLVRLQTGMTALAAALVALEPGHSGAEARSRLHAVVADLEAVRNDVASQRAAGTLGESARLDNALDATYEYLDAVGSLLSNPNSLLRNRLRPRAQRARAALAALPDPAGLPRTVAGWEGLQEFAAARRRN